MTDLTISSHQYTLAARWIFPIAAAPISGGWIRMDDGRVLEVAEGAPPSGDVIDLGDVAILPGLVNAHTHLEFSDLQQPIGSAGIALDQWIGQVIAERQATTPQSKAAAIRSGIDESRRAGVRIIGEIGTMPSDYAASNRYPPSELQLVTFAEVLGVSSQRSEERFYAAQQHIRSCASGAVSPHAPYSISQTAIGRCVDLAVEEKRAVAMHVAESPAERLLLEEGVGPFADILRQLGVWQDGLFPWPTDSFRWLISQLARSPLGLLVHGNDLRTDELDLISQHPHLSVVYCPRTHHFFQHDKHPVDKMLRRNIRVALGTDSRASNPDLQLWKEVQHLLNHRSDIDPADVLAMATLSGAQAFAASAAGAIAPGFSPGLGTVATEATSLEGVYRDFAKNDYQPVFKPTCSPSGA